MSQGYRHWSPRFDRKKHDLVSSLLKEAQSNLGRLHAKGEHVVDNVVDRVFCFEAVSYHEVVSTGSDRGEKLRPITFARVKPDKRLSATL